MKSKFTLALVMAVGLALGSVTAYAQDPAPTTQQQQPAPSPTPTPEKTFGDYTVTTSVEAGWRFFTTGGNLNKYRSDLNYDRGPRLLSFDFLARSKDGQGGAFDFLQVNATGWGGDPSAYLRVNVEKKKWYRFDGNFRKFDYFNNLANLALGQHISDTERRFGDFNLTLLPQNDRIKFNLGYSLDRSHGTSFTTYHINRDDFQIFAPVRNFAQDFRFGADAKLLGFDLSFMQGLRRFKDDSTLLIPGLNPGYNTTNTSVLTALQRQLPTRGDISFTRLSVHRLINQKLDFTGRYIYSSATAKFNYYETSTGVDASNNNIKLDQITTSGTTRRPNGVGDIGLTFYATDKLTISETFRVNNFRTNGGEVLSEAIFKTKNTLSGETPLPTVLSDLLSLRSVGYRQFLNTIEADYKFSKRFVAHVGYRHGERRLVLGAVTNVAVGKDYALAPEVERNKTNAVFAGFKAAPISIWKVYFDAEHGTADNAFTRLANYDYTNFRVRTNIKPTRTLLINASLVTKNNNNPSLSLDQSTPTGLGVDVKSRVFSTWVDWTPPGRLALSGGYTRTQIDTRADIIFFLSGVQQNGTSLYFMRDNSFFFNTRIQVVPRATLFVGYRINDDTGQGDRVSASPTQLLSSYPLRFQSPEAKLKIKIFEKVEWNAGWQYFGYKEKFFSNQNYRAHTAYTSIRIGF